MYTSRGNNAYGQQSYAGQSAYGQNLGAGYPANAAGGPDGNAQLPMVSRHSAMLGGSEEVDGNVYRPLPAAGAHYGGQYSSLYGSAALSTASQAPAVGAKGAGSSVLESRGLYASAKQDSPKFSSGEYIPASSHAQLYGEKGPDYSAIERRQFGRQNAYMGRDLQSEPTGRFADSVGFGPQHQAEIYDRIDKAVLLRQEQLLKAHSLQSASLEGSARQADYLAARGASSRHPTQELTSFGGRMDGDPRSLSMLSGSSYGELPAPSILGAAPRRNADDLLYSQNSSNPGYGVSLPPGRDYGSGKGLLVPSLESDYPISLSHGGHLRIDERKDDRASYLQEFELREEARRRDRLRERERDREREKEWDREREREREREKERERSILERRLKERERDRKRTIDTRRERTPPSVSRDRRGSSLVKEGRSLRRDSPHHEAAHRRHSPVKDKRREYVCKAYSFSLIDVERDYPSLNKRYPRLFIPSDFCKALVNWPRENLQLSIRTPVSFEHDFVEEDSVAVMKEPTAKLLAELPAKSGCGNIVWSVKVILMSGISKNALEELSSERSSDDRIPHICNIIRFAILKKDRSFMTIGGPWNSTDGGDPSVDGSCLIQTAIRHGKDVAKIDLQNCKNWNRFLEIHYDRIGKDGFFSHKEISVIFVPDLSECLPSLDAWRDQWLAHKKAVVERERQLSLRKVRLRGKEVLKDKEIESSKQKRTDKEEKKKDSASTGEAKQVKNKEQAGSNLNGSGSEGKDDMNDKKIEKGDSGSETGKNASEGKGDIKIEKKDYSGGERASETGKNASEEKGDMNDQKIEKKDDSGSERGKNEEKKEQVEAAETQTPGSVKSGKKKIVRKVVKQKVVGKLATDSTTNVGEKDNNEGPKENPETPGEESSADPAGVQTFKRKRLVKKVLVAKAAQNEDNTDTKVKVGQATVCSEEKDEPSSGAAVQDTTAKTVVKKKIIKKVAKRKAADVEQSKTVDVDEKKVVGDETEGTQKKTAGEEKPASEVTESGNEVVSKTKESKTEVSAKQNDVVSPTKADTKDVKEDKKDEKRTGDKSSSVTNAERSKAKGGENSKDEKDKKEKDGKDESRAKSNKEVKETRKPEEPPRHPGLILQTKFSKESKLRSSSLSLDLLLDYTDKDIEESTFELSVFAETFYEMLQHQMGSRLLTFLQKLRIKFVTKRNQRKRQREEENAEKANAKNSSAKRPKTDELPVKDVPAKSSETLATTQPDAVKQEEEKRQKADEVKMESSTVNHVDEVKMEQVTDDEEDPEEDPEEYEPMEDGSPPLDSNENMDEDGKSNVDVVPGNEKDEVSVKEEKDVNAEETKAKPEADTCEKKEEKVDTGKKETPRAKEVVDKELLQAFRFFDRNQVGHIRVEDMRLIIHNLGKFLSHRDVKELVQSALIESNTARDDRILYKKLVRMTDI